jgi:hypothetical protein
MYQIGAGMNGHAPPGFQDGAHEAAHSNIRPELARRPLAPTPLPLASDRDAEERDGE